MTKLLFLLTVIPCILGIFRYILIERSIVRVDDHNCKWYTLNRHKLKLSFKKLNVYMYFVISE